MNEEKKSSEPEMHEGREAFKRFALALRHDK
jgi:hypothetical protein